MDKVKHVGSRLGACGESLEPGEGVGSISEATCPECLKAMGAVSKFLGAATDRKTIPCAVCGLKKWRETDPKKLPGHHSRIRSKKACQCKE